MLVLTRKKDESILIEGGIEIMIVGIVGNAVKIGISAPRNVNIVRKEISKEQPLRKYVPK